jgi:hypothetical protein
MRPIIKALSPFNIQAEEVVQAEEVESGVSQEIMPGIIFFVNGY